VTASAVLNPPIDDEPNPYAALPAPKCPRWCDRDWCGDGFDTDGTNMHTTPFVNIGVIGFKAGPSLMSVTVHRIDDACDGEGVAEIHMLAGTVADHEDFAISPENALALAKALTVAARRAMPTDRIYEVQSFCPHCQTERAIRGRRTVSRSGVARIRNGRCQTCGTRNLNPILEQNGRLLPTVRVVPAEEVKTR
jgi:hypothetical protein